MAARRGVVFIREIVPRRLISWIANGLYQENYMTLQMRQRFSDPHDQVQVEDAGDFKVNGRGCGVNPLQVGIRLLILRKG